jgi:tetrahydromethanopterin S-methyltransferase subunit G
MGRRVGALFGMVVLLGLALLMMWNVYVHHSRGIIPEEQNNL